ncbi:hypothetical protein FRB97_007359 [Tulasnella sp. 331]|nr:hypothetical protein FRB97_007359 [Tulasnella sp. 331]
MATESATTLSRKFHNGNKIPWIGYGTGTSFKRHATDAVETVMTALSAGFTHIDCAELYNTEESLVIALQKYLSGPSRPPRDTIFLTTKFYDALEPGQTVRDRLKGSLRRLQVDYVDLYLVHTPMSHLGRLKDIWKQMEEVQREGLAKNIGVSNFRVKDYEEFIDEAEITPIEYSPYVMEAARPILALQEKHGILTVSYGGLTPLHKFKGGPIDPILSTIRERYSKDHGIDISEEQILTKWTLAKGVLPITQKERLVSILKTVELPDIQQAEIEQIDKAGLTEHHRGYVSARRQRILEALMTLRVLHSP